MSESAQGTFVSQKVSKIRWKHEDFMDAKNFLTGTWDDSNNKITYWTFKTNEENEIYPAAVAYYNFQGDVTELKFLSGNFFVASSSSGSVSVLEIIHKSEDYKLKKHMSWQSIHSFKSLDYASCTALSNFEQDIATVGEDGRINLLTATQKKPVRTIENADSCSIYCVDFLRHSEILTGNIRGHMKLWDLRNKDSPATTFMLFDRPKTEATSIAHHPTQRHIVIAGGGDGSLTVWDLRHNTYPMSQLNAHGNAVSEILFHEDKPENLFTCSASGELWHWNNSQNSKLRLDSDSYWLNTIGASSNVNVTSLCSTMHKPINSLDVDRSTLLFGCDNEAIYIIKSIGV